MVLKTVIASLDEALDVTAFFAVKFEHINPDDTRILLVWIFFFFGGVQV